MQKKSISIGTRRNATQILRRVSIWNISLALTLALLGGVLLGFFYRPSSAWGFGSGLLSVAILSALSWALEVLIARKFTNLQGLAFSAGFVLKIFWVFVFAWVLRKFAWVDMHFMLLGFMLGMVLSLAVSAALILQEDGPDFD